MGNRTLGHHAAQGSNSIEKEMEGERNDWYSERGGEWHKETEKPRTPGGGYTHTDRHAHAHAHAHTCAHVHLHNTYHKHTHTHKHMAPPLLCIFIYGCPQYMVILIPESSFHWPAPACAALMPKLILHDPFTLFTSIDWVLKQVRGSKPTIICGQLTCHSLCHWLYMEDGFTAQDEDILKVCLYMPATHYMWRAGHSMNTHSSGLHHLEQKLSDEVSSWLFLPEDLMPM